MADGNITVTLQDLRGDEAKEQALWAERGRWLAEKLSERTTPDARTVLELVEEPIWARADGTFADYCAAIDAAMAADEDWWASERPPTPVGWSDTDWLRHLESCPPIGYAVRDSLYGTSKAGVLRFCSSDEAGAFAVYASPRPMQTEPSPSTPPQVQGPLTDSDRIDFLQWLTTRTDYQNQKRPTESVGSDLHLGSGRSSLYVRDLFGNIVPGGASYSEDVRDTIDAVASVLRPNVRAERPQTAAPQPE